MPILALKEIYNFHKVRTLPCHRFLENEDEEYGFICP